MREIVVDVRERPSGIAEQLHLMGAMVREARLNAGDYLIGDTIGIERKTTADFVTTLTGGRLFDQLFALQTAVERPLLLIEGEHTPLARLHARALRGALIAVTVGWCIPILWSATVVETATWLWAMAARREYRRRPKCWPAPGKKSVDPRELQQRVLEQVPSIGPLTAEALINQFGNLEGVLSASSEALRQVDGVGKRRSETLQTVLQGSVAKPSP